MDWIKEIQKEDISDRILTFEEYMNLFQKHPRRECRPSCIYFKDMFSFFGKAEDGSFNLFRAEKPNFPPLRGQEKPQKDIFRCLTNFVEEGFNDKFILLVGPNGSAKTSLVRKIMSAAEDYSKNDEGALYTFSWIFPIDNYVKGSLGLSSQKQSRSLDSYAHIEDKDISAILGSDLKDHPFMLMPLERRRHLIEQLFASDSDFLNCIRKSYFYNGELSKRNKLIFDSLLKSNNGNYLEVYKHIRVERFYIDKRLSSGAVTIEPQMHVDASIQQITMDRRLASLPPSLQSLNLFSLSGEIVMANRGILEFSDILKRPIETYKYLLTTMENGAINLQGTISELDVFFIGTTNEVHFTAFKQHPDFNSFKGRFNILKVPYLLDYKKEEQIYELQINNLKDRCYFEQHSISALSLWAVMTRLRKPQSQNFKDKKLGTLVTRLTPIEKAQLFSLNITPEHMTLKEKKLLLASKSELELEYEKDPMYEGKFGVSPREIKQIIYDLSIDNDYVTFVEVIEYLKDFIQRKDQYDFLNISPQGDYHNNVKFLEFIEDFILNQFDSDLRDCLGLVDDRSYEDYISKYVHQITALIKGEKIKNKVTGKYQECDMYFISEFEKNIDIKDKPEDYRSHIVSRLGAFSIDHPGSPLIMTEVFPDIVKALKESFRQEQKKVIDNISENLVFYLSDKKGQLKQEAKDKIESIVDTLVDKYQYRREGAIRMLQYLIKKSY